MTTNMIPFESASLPAFVVADENSNDELFSGTTGGFPSISIKGMRFHRVQGGERLLITRPDSEDEPASYIEVVIVKAETGVSKTYYVDGYTEGESEGEKPTCYSNDGKAPAKDAEDPQHSNCASCPHNAWGSRVTEKGSKGKACSDNKRLAVAAAGLLNDPMLLRVPAASLKALDQFSAAISKRGVKYNRVVVRIGFDYSVAYPSLTFKPVGFVTEDMAKQIDEVAKEQVVSDITGAGFRDASAPAVGNAKQSSKQDTTSTASLDAAVAKADAAPKATTVKVEGEERDAVEVPEKPAAKTTKKTKAAPTVIDASNDEDLADEMEASLGAINFDD